MHRPVHNAQTRKRHRMFTEEQLAAIKKTVEDQIAGTLNTTLNQAVTSHLKRLEGKLATDTQAAVNAEVEKIRVEMEKNSGGSPPPAGQQQPPAGQNHGGLGLSPEAEKRMKMLEEQNTKLAKELETGNAQRAAAEKRAREQAANSRILSALDAGKVKPEVRELLATTWQANGRVTYDADGNPLLKIRKAQYAGGLEEDVDVPLEDGLKHWLGTKDAEPYLPPPSNHRHPAPAPGGRVPAPFAPPPRMPTQQQSNGRPAPFNEDAAARVAASVLLGDSELFTHD